MKRHLKFQVKVEAIGAKMLSRKEHGARAKGYKGQLAKVVKRVEKAKE